MRQELNQRRYAMMTRSMPLGLTGPIVGPSIATLDYNPSLDTRLAALAESIAAAKAITDSIEQDEPSSIDIGDGETIRIIVNDDMADNGKRRIWVDAVLDYCETYGTEAYIKSLGFNLEGTKTQRTPMGERRTLNSEGDSVPVVFYRKTMRGKSVRYVECDRQCGEVLYIKKGKRYVVVS